jgi:teichuronic acid biosynthesis glycosyltransferase TuaC
VLVKNGLRRRWSAVRTAVAALGLALLATAIWPVLPHLDGGTELVRLRHALLLGPDLPATTDWQPPAWPNDFRRDHRPTTAYFAEQAKLLGLAAIPGDWARSQAIGRQLLTSASALTGTPIRRGLEDTHRTIVREGRGYCGDFVRAFEALGQAGGLVVRPWAFSFDGYGGHGHIWLEVWNREVARWQLIDVFNNQWFSAEPGGPALGALELLQLMRAGGTPSVRRWVAGGRLGYEDETKYLQYVRRGLSQWMLVSGNNVTSVDQSGLVRLLRPLGRVAEGVGVVLAGDSPKVRMVVVPESAKQRQAMHRLHAGLARSAILGPLGFLLLATAAWWRRTPAPMPRRAHGEDEDALATLWSGCIAVYSALFPHAGEPQAGLFIRERMFRVAGPAQLVVVSPRPWFPLQGLIRLVVPGYRPPTATYECQQGVDVWFPRYLAVPGGLRRLDGLSMALCTLPLMRRLKRERGLTLIDAHFAYPAGAAAGWLGRWLGLPVTVTLRGTEVRQLADRALRPSVLRALEHAVRVFSVSDSLRRVAAGAGADQAKLHVVGNGVDLGKFQRLSQAAARSRLGIDAEALVLVSVGGLVERKGFHRVIELLPNLLRRFPGLLFLVIGGPSPEGDISERLRRQVAELGLQACVRFLGPMAPEALHVPLSAADVFVLATSNEGWANVLLEAMACGLPVITTDVGGNREVVCSPQLGTVVPFGDPIALSEALAEALVHPWDRDAIVRYAQDNDWSRRVSVLQQHFAQIAPVR